MEWLELLLMFGSFYDSDEEEEVKPAPKPVKPTKPSSPTVTISPMLQAETGWLLSSQSAEDLYKWCTNKYGKPLNMNHTEGQLLRTMKADSYFIFVDYARAKK